MLRAARRGARRVLQHMAADHEVERPRAQRRRDRLGRAADVEPPVDIAARRADRCRRNARGRRSAWRSGCASCVRCDPKPTTASRLAGPAARAGRQLSATRSSSSSTSRVDAGADDAQLALARGQRRVAGGGSFAHHEDVHAPRPVGAELHRLLDVAGARRAGDGIDRPRHGDSCHSAARRRAHTSS